MRRVKKEISVYLLPTYLVKYLTAFMAPFKGGEDVQQAMVCPRNRQIWDQIGKEHFSVVGIIFQNVHFFRYNVRQK